MGFLDNLTEIATDLAQSGAAASKHLAETSIATVSYTHLDVYKRQYEDKAFTYFLSDKIFDDLEDSSVREAEDLRVGDLIYDDYEEKYGLVLSVDTRNETVDYATVDDDNEIDWDGWCDFDDLSDMTTRYPDEDEDNDQGDEELTNGKPTTERNVSNLLDDLMEDYEQGDVYKRQTRGRPSTA